MGAYVRERARKARVAMREVWGIDKRWFGGMRAEDCSSMVWTVMGYEVEVWGWRERKRLERMRERIGMWVLGVKWRYMMREDLVEKAEAEGRQEEFGERLRGEGDCVREKVFGRDKEGEEGEGIIEMRKREEGMYRGEKADWES